MSVEPWQEVARRDLVSTRVLDVVEVTATNPRTGDDRAFTRIRAADWVNVVALTPERHVVLVRQYRHGTEEVTLEIPGGLVDDEEDPAVAAVRELREETGFTGGQVSHLGTVAANPAVQDNRLHTYLVDGCTRTDDLRLDDGEDIEVLTVPLDDVPRLIADGAITHALVVVGFWHLFSPG